MKDKDKKMLFGIGIVFLFLATVGFSYAYFSSAITNKDVKDQIVETGTLRLTYTDGPEIVINNVKPGTTFTKEVSVKNTGTLDTAYNLVWQELNNEITNDEMVMSATCERQNSSGTVEGICEGLSETAIGDNNIKKNITIESGVTHKYVITITFKDTNAEQNYNQNKKFSGVLGVNEYKTSVPEVLNCSFEGTVSNGTKYTNGIYTYTYYSGNKGWSVVLTNKNSTDSINEAPCTYINDVPVVSMAGMFKESGATTLDLSSFNTSNVTNMQEMFYNSKLVTILGLENLNTSKVTNMKRMFSSVKAQTIDVSNFDTSNVTDMYGMFEDTEVTTLDLSGFNTSKVTDMSYMFISAKATTLDLNNFDTSKVVYMAGMFDSCGATTIKLDNFNTSSVGDMSYMFHKTKVSELNISSFDTSNVSSMNYMFAYCENLTKVYASNNFVTSAVNGWDIDNMPIRVFIGTDNLVGGAGTTHDGEADGSPIDGDLKYAKVDEGTSSPGYFTLKTN